MGATASSRKVSMSNPNPDTPGVIQISSDLAQRIARTATAQDKKDTRPATHAHDGSHPQAPTVTAPVSAPVSTHVMPLYNPEVSMTALHIRQQKECEIKELEEEWQRKLKQQEAKYVSMGKLTEEEFRAAISEVEKMFHQPHGPVCQDQQSQVLNCYQLHPQRSLQCAKAVQAFSHCVELTRMVPNKPCGQPNPPS